MPRRKQPDPFLAAIGARIREHREAQGLTQEKLAWESGRSSKGYLSDVESGRASPKLEFLRGVAFRLGVSVADLVSVPLGAPSAAERGVRYEPTPRTRRRRARR